MEVERRFSQVASGWLAGWTPAAKISGEVSSVGGYQLGLEGSLAGEHVDFTFGFSFLEADGNSELTFAALTPDAKLTAAATLKTLSVSFVAADGTLVSVSLKPTVKLTIRPDYRALLRFFLQRCAAVVASNLALIGGVVAGAAVLIGGYVLTLADGKKMASIVDQAVIARRDYVAGFMAAAMPGTDYTFNNDYQMEGHNRGSQWLRDIQAGVGKDGLPVPESVVREQVAVHHATARTAATEAINAYLHQLLVTQYWEIHWGRKFMRYPIETTFLMMMEGTGFGRPAPHATGEEPAENVPIPAP